MALFLSKISAVQLYYMSFETFLAGLIEADTFSQWLEKINSALVMVGRQVEEGKIS